MWTWSGPTDAGPVLDPKSLSTDFGVTFQLLRSEVTDKQLKLLEKRWPTAVLVS